MTGKAVNEIAGCACSRRRIKQAPIQERSKSFEYSGHGAGGADIYRFSQQKGRLPTPSR